MFELYQARAAHRDQLLCCIYGFLKVWMRAFFVHGFRGMNGFLSVFHGEFHIIRAIRVQKLIPSSDNEKAILLYLPK
ncbi:MAG: hypothetical protein ACOYYF_15910 [Chloroflexota bacterium]|nr:hypothetical protein [Chloroflexota bacterium]MBI5704800.1 hypothetical protein [Chloroflexota bacterium]